MAIVVQEKWLMRVLCKSIEMNANCFNKFEKMFKH